MTERKLKWFGAGIATLFALVVYTMTMSPTVSFWDCGEYVSAGNILGVPHPPGMSLHHILARISIISFVWWDDIAARVNWLSALASALIAGTAYLIAFRGIQMLQTRDERKSNVWVAVMGGTIGALLVTFCDTLWFSSVEAEMYTPAMFFTLFSVYLMLEWTDLRSTPWGDRLLVFVVYMSFLGVNFTMFTVMFIPIICIWVVALDENKRRLYPLYIGGTLLMSIIYMPGTFPFIALCLAVVSFVLAGFPVLGQGRGWKLVGLLSTVAVLGWSMYLYIPIRASLNPIIDEGDPQIRKPLVVGDPSTYDNLKKRPSFSDAFSLANWGEFQEYIERKQYGSENMIVRSLTRRSNFLNQILLHENMGYGGYMIQQFLPFKVQRDNSLFGIKIPSQLGMLGVNSIKGEDNQYVQAPGWEAKRLAQLAAVVLALLPLWWLFSFGWSRHRELTLLLAGLYIFSSFGMLWYVNFADGTKPEVSDYKYWMESRARGEDSQFPDPVHMEVRERDYFFTPSFVLLGILYGMAAALFAQQMRAGRKDDWRKQPKFVAYVALVSLFPVLAGASNWHENDRHLNWVPFDYSYNLLNSCEPNGILFTNGDNDTFPLWALQEAFGIRKDVRLVNLSLINTDWYIRQMRDIEPKVPIDMSDALIRQLNPERNTIPAGAAIQVGPRVVAFPSAKELPYIKIQDRMIMHIVMANDKMAKRKPIHFAATVGEENMLGLAPYCRMHGMVYTLTDSIQADPVDIDRTVDLFTKVYRFRGMGGDKYSKGYLDDDTRRLESNYSSIAIQAAMGSAEGIRRLYDSASRPNVPDSVKAILKRKADDRLTKVVQLIQNSEHMIPREWRTAYFGSQLFTQLGRTASADSTLALARKRLPNEPMLVRAQAEVFQRTGRLEQAAKLLDSSAKANPNDAQLLLDAAMMLAETGHSTEAMAHVEKALKLNPADQRAQGLAQQIQRRMQAEPRPPVAPVVIPAPAAPVAPVPVNPASVPPAQQPAPLKK